ncbi:hypothetical protein KA005_64715, partial [bacterium]|nr:hypothetical protein [bacterium]
PVAEILRNWWGNDANLSHFEKSGHEYESVFDVGLIKQELGFVAERLPCSKNAQITFQSH